MNKELFNFNEVTDEQLKALYDSIAKELSSRKYAKKQKLVEDVCTAINALKTEFPDVSFEVEMDLQCPLCDETYEDLIDVFGFFNKATPEMFSWG